MRDYDQEPIVVYSPCTFEQLKQFQRMHYRRYKSITILSLCILATVVVRWIIARDYYTPSRELIFIMIYFAVTSCHRLLAYNGSLYTRKTYDQYKSSYRGGGLYQFMNDHYIAKREDGDYQVTKDSPYDDVIKIAETRDLLFLYTVPSQAQVVDKAAIRDNSVTPEELSAFLREKFKDVKYEFIGQKVPFFHVLSNDGSDSDSDSMG